MSTTRTFILIITVSFYLISCNNKKNTLESNPSESIESLKNVFKSDFYIGAAINDAQINETDSLSVTILKKEFNSITPENIMKWMYMEPQQNKFNFEMSDKYVALGEKNNMYIVGHTLVWHSQLADWVEKINDSAALASSIENHIIFFFNILF